jgi:hypothetical protein
MLNCPLSPVSTNLTVTILMADEKCLVAAGSAPDVNTLLHEQKAMYEPHYRAFQKELYNFEGLYKFIHRTCTVF